MNIKLNIWQLIADNFARTDAATMARYERMRERHPLYACWSLEEHEAQRAYIAGMLAKPCVRVAVA
jgi:hypothetical protein